MVIFPLAPDQTIAQMWSNGARGGLRDDYVDTLLKLWLHVVMFEWRQESTEEWSATLTVVTLQTKIALLSTRSATLYEVINRALKQRQALWRLAYTRWLIVHAGRMWVRIWRPISNNGPLNPLDLDGGEGAVGGCEADSFSDWLISVVAMPHYKAVSLMLVTGVLHVDYSLTKLKQNSSGLVLRRSLVKFQKVRWTWQSAPTSFSQWS